jgi:ribosomal protein S1
MIENYDSINDLYIISYKKYIKHTLPQKVYDLEFGKKYTGILTNKPYEFGIFIEFQNYYTGLLHKSEFANYIEDTSTFKSGDVLDFYIKDIIVKKGEPRIILTNDLAKVDQEKITWQKLKTEIEGRTLNFVLNKDNFFIEITIPETNEIFKNDVNHLKGKFRIPNDGEVKILKVDTIRKTLKLDFINA